MDEAMEFISRHREIDKDGKYKWIKTPKWEDEKNDKENKTNNSGLVNQMREVLKKGGY